MRYTIGLDIGIASIGWSVINEEKNRIENLGVRTFKKAEEEDGKPINLARREARSARRRIRRRATRMRKVKELLVKYKIVSEKELVTLYQLSNLDKEVWELRTEGLDLLLHRKEWARVLTNIAKRRGYKSNRKTEVEDKEVGRLSEGILSNKKLLEEKSYRTIGEMFYKDEKFKSSKRNKSGEYTNTVLRKLLIDEVHQLFEAQRKLNSKFASEVFESEYLKIITCQKPYITPELLEKMLGTCTLEKNEHRAPKNSYTFERFTLLQKVNNLRIQVNGEKFEIPLGKKREIIELAYNKTEITYGQLRKILQLPLEAKFVDLNYFMNRKNEELSEEVVVNNAEKKKFIKLEGWHKIRSALNKEFNMVKEKTELQNVIADALVRNKTDETIKEYLKNKGFEDEIINSLLSINFNKFGHLSYKAMKKLIPEMEKGLTYDKACTAVGYNFSGDKQNLQYKLPPVCDLNYAILNPVVLRAVSETRRIINNIIDLYGSPTAIYIETGRELSKPYDERRRIEKRQQDNTKKNEEIKEYIKENFKLEPKPFDIVKIKLWREQNGKCAYSGRAISAERLFEDNFVQVDHIIPFSRSFDDSYQNKVLVLANENQKKQEKTPFEYFGENKEKWHQFEEFVNITYKFNNRKRENLLIKNFNEEKSKAWMSRNINDTRYIAKFMNSYISNNLEFAPSELKIKVYNINGQTTAVLRHFWGLKKDREESDKHHALDAVVIACASTKNIMKVAEYNKRKKLYFKSNEDIKYNDELAIKEPWPRFREEVEARMEEADNTGMLYSLVNGKFYNYDDIEVEKVKPILVSRKVDKSIKGRAHKDTMYSQKFIKQGLKFKTVKRDLTKLSKREIEELVTKEEYRALYLSDKAMYDDIYEKMKANNFKADKAFANGYRKHSKNENGPIVRSITIAEGGTTGVRLKNNAIANNDEMIRVDVFEKDGKYYLVPIYVADFVKKQLPNKAIVASKDEQDWTKITEEYNFKFSLYKNDFIKIKPKRGNNIFSYYKGTDRSNASIKLLKNPNVTGKKSSEVYGSKTLEVFEKYQVDVLGNISKVKKEGRKELN